MSAVETVPPHTPRRIDFPTPDQIPELDQDPTIPPKIIDDPSPRTPDTGDIDDDPMQEPPTHGEEGSP